jgi:predicted permease
MRLDRASTGAVVLATAFGNTTFFGYPVILAFYGPDHLAPAVLYDLLGASIAANSLGVLVASVCGQGDGAAGLGSILRRFASLPPLWALALGLALRGVRLPDVLDQVLAHMGVATVPLIMLSIGMSLEVRHGRREWRIAGLVAAGRLLLVPGVVYAVTGALDLPLEWRRAAVLQAGMPTMFFALTLSLLFRLRVELALDTIVATLVVGVATLPFWRWMVG